MLSIRGHAACARGQADLSPSSLSPRPTDKQANLTASGARRFTLFFFLIAHMRMWQTFKRSVFWFSMQRFFIFY